MNYLKKAGKWMIAACLFGGMLMTTANVSASELQTHIMTVQNESTTLKELFDLIEEKFDYTFLIRNNDIDMNERISIDMSDRSVEEILNYALKNQNAAFTVNDNRIVVYKSNSPRQTATVPVAQQSQRINGVVVDQITGETIIGANVMVKGTTVGTSTDFDGNFSLEVPAGATLVVSYIGYVNLEITAAPNMTIRLREDTQALEEVVVVGYSTQRRESLTGSLNTLKNEKLLTQTSANVEGMLSGKAPGVFVAPGDGRPGSKGNILIRGKASINGNTDPLWVVDGVIIGNNSGYAVNPMDIETMTILKDASSTAMYGSQGANGVVVITTKRATGDKVRVSFSGKIGVNDAYNGNLELMNGAELYDYFKSFNNQEAITFPRWNENLRNSNFDWWDFATRSGLVQDYNVSISGGSDKVKSYFSIGYLDEQGTVKGLDFDQYSFRFRTEYKPLDWLTIKPSLSGSKRHEVNKEYSTTAMYVNLPWDSPYNEDGSIASHYNPNWVNSNSTNYLYDLQWNGGEYDRYSFFGNLDFDIQITDWLKFTSVNNYNWSNYAYQYLTDPRSNVGSGVSGRLEEVSEWTTRRYTNQLLHFNKSFDKHSIIGLVAYEFQDYRFKRVQTIGTGFVPGFSVLDVTAVPEKTAGYINESAMQSYFGEVNYSYDNKYMGRLTARRDGASNFGDNAKYGNFFSISGAWNIHREEFFTATWVDQLKLRASYGTNGNRPSSLYPQYDLYSVSASYKENAGTLISQIGNKDLTWEETATFGVGVDFSFLERFRVTADYYNKFTDNVLFNVPISGLTGVTSIWQNIGEIENRGIELTLGADLVQTRDWNWTVDVNLGKNTNEVKKLYEGVDEIVNTNFGGPAGSISRLLKPGYSSDTYYSREWAGVNPENGAPQWYKTDENGNRVLTEKYSEADEVICGEYTPDFYGGFSTNLQWKQFDLNAVFGFSVGGKIYNYSRTEYDSDGTYTDRNQMKLLDSWSRWQKPGDNATHPVAVYENKSLANSVSSRYLEDGDYLKLRSLSIGYNLQLPQFKIPTLRLSFTAENLFTLTGYSGTDPEIPVNDGKVTGVTGASNYPIVRKFMFGINFTL